MIHPDLYQEITRLSDLLRAKFSPPEFIPGCQVKSVADVSLYAANNGWIEAICGQHNQQRVRWKSAETVAVDDYIDVLYFPDRRLFEAYGLGGAGAITPTGGNVWPKADQNLLDGVNYATATLLIAAMSSGAIGYLGERASAEAVTLNVASVTLRGVGASATIFEDIFSITATSSRVREISIDSSGSNARGFDVNVNGTAVLEDCEAACFGTTTSRALDVSTPSAGATVTVIGGRYNGIGTLPFDVYADTDATIELRGPVLANQTIGGPGTVTGYYYDDSGNFYVVPGTGIVAPGLFTPNPFINGALQFWQRGTSFAAVANLTRVADGLKYAKVGAMVHTVSESTDVPTIAEIETKLGSSMLIDCTTADGTIAAGDVCTISRAIEGYNFLNLTNGFTISFWVKGTKTGIHCIAFENSGGDRTYVAEYTINTTATWERKTVTVPATPTAGTWSYTTSAGLWISWALACGSTFQTTAGAWQTGHFYGTANQVNACDDAANDFRITGIKIEPGSVATPFLLPDYEQEFARCQRYTWVMPTQKVGLAINANVLYGGGGIIFPTLMRAAPTMSNATFTVNAGSAGTPAISTSSAHGLDVYNIDNNWTANALVSLAATFSAEF